MARVADLVAEVLGEPGKSPPRRERKGRFADLPTIATGRKPEPEEDQPEPGVEQAVAEVLEATLSGKDRKGLPDSSFALSGRRYPIHDESHARNALSRSSGKPEEGQVRAAVRRRYPKLVQEAARGGMVKCPRCETLNGKSATTCKNCGKSMKRVAAKAKDDGRTDVKEAVAEALKRGSERAAKLKRLPDGTFAPKGLGRVLRPGDRVKLPDGREGMLMQRSQPGMTGGGENFVKLDDGTEVPGKVATHGRKGLMDRAADRRTARSPVGEAVVAVLEATDSPKVPITNKPGVSNWVEKYNALGGKDNWIRRTAEHLKGKDMPEGRAIPVAVNAAKRMCSSGDTNFPGAQQVNAGSRAQACAAVKTWETAKARSKAGSVTESQLAAVVEAEVDPRRMSRAEHRLVIALVREAAEPEPEVPGTIAGLVSEALIGRGGARKVVELKRLDDGTFAPKGLGRALKAGQQVRFPSGATGRVQYQSPDNMSGTGAIAVHTNKGAANIVDGKARWDPGELSSGGGKATPKLSRRAGDAVGKIGGHLDGQGIWLDDALDMGVGKRELDELVAAGVLEMTTGSGGSTWYRRTRG